MMFTPEVQTQLREPHLPPRKPDRRQGLARAFAVSLGGRGSVVRYCDVYYRVGVAPVTLVNKVGC